MLVGYSDVPPATRISQVAVLLGIGPVVPTRISQSAVIIGSRTSPVTTCISQVAVIVGVGVDAAPCLTQEAYCWKITRTDGVEYRYTSHDRDVTLRGQTYSPCDGLETSAMQVNAEIGSTSGFDISGIITAAKITEIDLWAGIFDGAAVEVWRTSWASDRTYEKLIAAGDLAKLEFGDQGFKYEVVTAAERLQQRPLLQAVTPSCRFKLYDNRCGVNPASFTQTGAATGVYGTNLLTQVTRRQFLDSSRAEADDYWQLGRLAWTGGNNSGQAHDVRAFASGMFTLETPTRYPVRS